MGKLKIFGAWLKKWRFLWLSILLILAPVSMFIYSVAGNLWLRYPLFLKTPLAFEKLSLSAFEEPLCHERCLLKRLLARGVLVDSLKNGKQGAASKIIRTLAAPDESLAFKEELLLAWREAYGQNNLSPDLLAVFQNSNDQDLRVFFQNNFDLPLDSWREKERSTALASNLPLERRAASLQMLAKQDPDFFAWSMSEEILFEKPLMKFLLKDLMLSPNQKPLPADFWEKIWPKLLVSDEQGRNWAIFLARAQAPIAKNEAADFLIKAYRSPAFSVFSRSFAAEILKRQGAGQDFPLPEIKDQDLEKYLLGDNL